MKLKPLYRYMVIDKNGDPSGSEVLYRTTLEAEEERRFSAVYYKNAGLLPFTVVLVKVTAA